MTLRARLTVAFLALAVVPLAALVVVTYSSSLSAYRRAVEQESRAEAERLNARMERVRGDLSAGVARAGRLVARAGQPGSGDPPGLEHRLRTELGPVAPLVEGLEFVPAEAPEAPAGALPNAEEPPFAEVPPPVLFLLHHPPPAPPVPPGRTEAELAAAQRRELVGEAVSRSVELIGRAIELSREKDEARRQELEAAMEAAAVAGGMRLAVEALEASGALEDVDLATIIAQSARVKEQLEGHIPALKELDLAELAALAARRRRIEAVLGGQIGVPVERDEQLVGHLYAQVRPDRVLQAVLADTRSSEGEIAFAMDREGRLYTANPEDEAVLATLPLDGDSPAETTRDSWIVVRSTDELSGTSFGVARPVGEGLEDIRRTAARNLGVGLALVVAAAFGIWPLSRRMTRHLGDLSTATESLAAGDLGVRVPASSSDEIGRLGRAFNHMASELAANQQRLLDTERERQEQELRTRLVEAENARRGAELERAREFQLSMLPSELPEHPNLEIAVSMRTATEVGGDYYDFRVDDDGWLTAVLGDATGHGAVAGTMVTVVKCLFTATSHLAPAAFLEHAAATIRRLHLGRMLMSLAVVRLSGNRLVVTAAGMPPLLVARAATGDVEELAVPGVPLGALEAAEYDEVGAALAPGDTVVLMSDGLPELLDAAGEPLGYDRVRQVVADAAGAAPEDVIGQLVAAADRWRGDRPLGDDMTFVVVRVRA